VTEHALRLADKLRRAVDEGQSPWTDEGTCLVFADAAKTLAALVERVEAAENETRRLEGVYGDRGKREWMLEEALDNSAARVAELEEERDNAIAAFNEQCARLDAIEEIVTGVPVAEEEK
jgi:chromosome segregation ATPase